MPGSSVVLLYVAWKRGFPRKFARFALFRQIKKRSFNLLCVLDLFQNAGSQLCFRFFFFVFHCGHDVTKSVFNIHNAQREIIYCFITVMRVTKFVFDIHIAEREMQKDRS